MDLKEAYLLIGGNIGNRKAYLSAAREAIASACGDIIQSSSIYETAAWGIEEQSAFLNQALKIKTGLDPNVLLEKILAIEEKLGRKRQLKYGPRIIDIDILLYNGEIVRTPGLTIPHPQMQKRRFVLAPLNEIAANEVHPVFLKTITRLLEECPDNLAVQKIT